MYCNNINHYSLQAVKEIHRTVAEMWETEYRVDFPGPVWKTHAKRFDIARSLRPLPEEAVFLISV